VVGFQDLGLQFESVSFPFAGSCAGADGADAFPFAAVVVLNFGVAVEVDFFAHHSLCGLPLRVSLRLPPSRRPGPNPYQDLYFQPRPRRL
jgi:hypothetical protein